MEYLEKVGNCLLEINMQHNALQKNKKSNVEMTWKQFSNVLYVYGLCGFELSKHPKFSENMVSSLIIWTIHKLSYQHIKLSFFWPFAVVRACLPDFLEDVFGIDERSEVADVVNHNKTICPVYWLLQYTPGFRALSGKKSKNINVLLFWNLVKIYSVYKIKKKLEHR